MSNSAIFTRLTNEVRDDNVILTQTYRKEHTHVAPEMHLTAKFLSTYEAEKDVMDEVESILFQHSIGGSSSIGAHTSLGSWKTSPSPMRPRAGSPGGRSLGSREGRLRQRAGEMKHVTDKWHKGPVAIGQPRILGPLKAKNGESLTNPKAKKVQRQTLKLLHNMERVGEISRRHATIRRRIMQDAKESGKDHVLKSLEPYLPETEEVKAEKLMLSLILARSRARVRFVPLSSIPRPPPRLTGLETPEQRETRLLLHRLEILWEILNPPDAVKLEFKFIIKQMSDENAFDHRGKLNHLSVMGLEDLYSHISVLEVLRRVFDDCTENRVNPYCESESLLTPVVDMSAEVGLKRITKGLREDIYGWMLRILDALVQKIQVIIEIWAIYRDKCSDGFGVQFFENLSDEVAALLPDGVPKFAVLARSRPNSSAADEVTVTTASLDSSGSPRARKDSMVSMTSTVSGTSAASLRKKAARSTAPPKPVPRDATPAESRATSRGGKSSDSNAGSRKQSTQSFSFVEEEPPPVITRQQYLLDQIHKTKIMHVVDVGDLMKYYQKKPNIRQSYSAEVKAAEEAAAAELAAIEAAAKKKAALEAGLLQTNGLLPGEEAEALTRSPALPRVPKPPMLSMTADTFSFSDGDLNTII